MIRLDRISMQGFKSFAGKVTIPFPAGFNVIAGPNGSGKSNIVDATCFVLGTSSAKAIRADKLHGLIFNGGKDREAAEFCKVSLYLDNRDGDIGGELASEKEVKVSRKINTKGLSMYKLNGRTVNKRRVVELMSSIGLSPDGYNIIMQGDVTKIIEMSPLERKQIINDISGISEFDDKREKAFKELQKVEDRVKEMLIIVSEKQKLKERLKLEKESAEKYVKLQGDLTKTKASLVNKKFQEADSEWKELTKNIKESEKQFESQNKEFESYDKKLETEERNLQKANEDIIKKTKDFSLSRDMDQFKLDVARKQDKLEFNRREAARLGEISAQIQSKEPAIKAVLSLGMTGVHGTIGSLLKIPKNYATAVQVALGKHINDIVVSDDKIASDCIRYLKDKRVGKARFLPLNKIRGREAREKPSEAIDFAINLVKFDARFSEAMKYVLGNTIVVDNIETARTVMKKQRIRTATLDGDLVEESGAMIGGFHAKRMTQAPDYSKELEGIEQENEQLERDIADIKKKLADLEKKRGKEITGVSELEKKRGLIEKSLKEFRESRKEWYEKRLNIQTKLSEMKISRAKLEARLDNLKQEREEFRDVKSLYNKPQEELLNDIKQFIIAINQLGPVNMKAIDEYGTIEVEFGELKSKLDRLLQEKEAIVQTAQEIEKKRYDKFMETLTNITYHFSRIYHDLAAGEGRLRLEEAENIDSGLVIEAVPRGKKALLLDSMSGGEKTLTALAFLFAIQQHDPAPFYILDEVDAALDKYNTKKITDLLKKYSRDVQFIVITHNDTTIAAADKVFGVSMESGISKVFGIEMPKAEETRAAQEIATSNE